MNQIDDLLKKPLQQSPVFRNKISPPRHLRLKSNLPAVTLSDHPQAGGPAVHRIELPVKGKAAEGFREFFIT